MFFKANNLILIETNIFIKNSHLSYDKIVINYHRLKPIGWFQYQNIHIWTLKIQNFKIYHQMLNNPNIEVNLFKLFEQTIISKLAINTTR